MRQKGIATRQRAFATDSKNASIKLRLFKIRSETVEVLVGIGDFFLKRKLQAGNGSVWKIRTRVNNLKKFYVFP